MNTKQSKVTTNILKEHPTKHVHLLIGKRAVDHAMIRLVEPIKRTYSVIVDFGNEKHYCSCTCPNVKNNRMICKHFFAVTEANHSIFNDTSKIFRDYVRINLDSKVFTLSSLTNTHLKKSSSNTEFQTNV